MVQCVGLAALSVFIHDHPSHCLPVWPTTGLGRDWPLGGVDNVAFAGRRLIFGYRRLFRARRLGVHSTAEFTHRVSPTHSVLPPTPSPEINREINVQIRHQISKHLRRVFGNTVKIIRSTEARSAARSSFRLLVRVAPSRSIPAAFVGQTEGTFFPSQPSFISRGLELRRFFGCPFIHIRTASTNRDGVATV